jgi:hypothetical protein
VEALAPAPSDPENGEEQQWADDPTVALCTPTRLHHADALITPDTLDADAFAAPLYRRVVGLAVCYGPEALPDETLAAWQDGFKALAAPTTLVKDGVEWKKDRRYSHRQERRVPAGGLVGSIRIDAPPEALRLWRRWLRRAETIHLGSGTSMGLGRLRVEDGDSVS